MKDIIEVVECSVTEVGPEDDEITRPANEIWPGWIPVAQDAGQKAAGTRSWIRPVPRVEPAEEPTLRDRFAGQALTGYVDFIPSDETQQGEVTARLAQKAYALADAMLVERDKHLVQLFSKDAVHA